MKCCWKISLPVRDWPQEVIKGTQVSFGVDSYTATNGLPVSISFSKQWAVPEDRERRLWSLGFQYNQICSFLKNATERTLQMCYSILYYNLEVLRIHSSGFYKSRQSSQLALSLANLEWGFLYLGKVGLQRQQLTTPGRYRLGSFG